MHAVSQPTSQYENLHPQNRIIRKTHTRHSYVRCVHISNIFNSKAIVHLSWNKSVKTSSLSFRLHSPINSIKTTKIHKLSQYFKTTNKNKEKTNKKRRSRRTYLSCLNISAVRTVEKDIDVHVGVCGLSTSDDIERNKSHQIAPVLYIILRLPILSYSNCEVSLIHFFGWLYPPTPPHGLSLLRPTAAQTVQTVQTNDIITYTIPVNTQQRGAHNNE